MVFLDKRIGVICDQLEKLSVKQKMPIDCFIYKKGNFLRPQDATDDGAAFELFDCEKMHWYGPDAHYWFRAIYTVPQEFHEKPLWLYVRTQIEEWDDGKNPQFLLFSNGDILQGIDMNHREVLLETSAAAKAEYRLDLQAYTGTLHSEFKLIVEAREIDPEIMGLYYDLRVPLNAFPKLEKDGKARRELELALNNAINILDLRTPYSDNFYASVNQARNYLKKTVYTALAGYDDVVATCIGHTHIDVAWWWTVEQTREKTARSFATVLKLMDEYPEYKFMSSQPQLYEFLKTRYPELYSRVKERISEKRWEPEGGMWVESDTNVTSGESLIRQFMHGKRYFRDEFGLDNRILWLPDVFGYTGALPQIMAGCGIDYFMTTKLSWNQFNKIPNDTFLWRGIDGTEILTHFVTTLGVGQDEENFFTTYNGNLHPDAIIGGWNRYQNKNINNDILISYGYGDGGGGPTRAMLETSKRMEKGMTGIPKVRQAFTRTYFDELASKVSGNPRLNVWEGELYFEYHRGTLTSMARNKRANRKSEFQMMDLELLSVLAKRNLPSDDYENAWKTILMNQFHDILPGTSIHEVYEVTKREYEQARANIDGHISSLLAELSGDSDCSNTDCYLSGKGCAADNEEIITVFNTTGFTRDDIVLLGERSAKAIKGFDSVTHLVQQTSDGAVAFLKNIPPKGWRVFYTTSAETGDNTQSDANSPFILGENNRLETPFYVVTIDENGLISGLYDKENCREVIQDGKRANLMCMYEDKPIYYDNWDIDVFYTEKSWDITSLTHFEWTDFGPVRATLEIKREISSSIISQKIRFYAESRRIDFETTVDWKESQHLLKVHFPVNIHTDEATFDIQFGNLTRKTHSNTSWDMARFESCGQKWVDLSEGHYGVSLLNDCKYGHSVKDSCIGLTLIKSGIEPNPVTDQEVHEFVYSLYPHKGNWRDGGTVKQGYFLNQQSLISPGAAKVGFFSLASSDSDNVVIETIKPAEDGDGIILRVYECDNSLSNAVITLGRPLRSAEECNMLEDKICDVDFSDNKVRFQIKPYEIKTIRIR
ncbi:MAG: alpha-mannosidase [Oscillospiraceae bacterium]|nr:alpha-mannosidase [Oscillospiraceae bacterium]MCL2279404.1 alpha-mannosidase [Oscillospiraceae bacterium]